MSLRSFFFIFLVVGMGFLSFLLWKGSRVSSPSPSVLKKTKKTPSNSFLPPFLNKPHIKKNKPLDIKKLPSRKFPSDQFQNIEIKISPNTSLDKPQEPPSTLLSSTQPPLPSSAPTDLTQKKNKQRRFPLRDISRLISIIQSHQNVSPENEEYEWEIKQTPQPFSEELSRDAQHLKTYASELISSSVMAFLLTQNSNKSASESSEDFLFELTPTQQSLISVPTISFSSFRTLKTENFKTLNQGVFFKGLRLQSDKIWEGRKKIEQKTEGKKRRRLSTVFILTYHQFAPIGRWNKTNPYTIPADVFEKQMLWIKQSGIEIISFSYFMRFLNGEIALPPRCVVITIDDGFRSVYQYAYPILSSLRIPWTFFIPTNFIETSPYAVNWEELKEMQNNGASVQSKTKMLPLLTHRRNYNSDEFEKWLSSELKDSREEIQRKLKSTVRYLAYPFGDWDRRVERQAHRAGYSAMVTLSPNPIGEDTPPHRIGRIVVDMNNGGSIEEFRKIFKDDPLVIKTVSPGSGTIVKYHRPFISGTIVYPERFEEKSVKISVEKFGDLKTLFDPKSGKVSAQVPGNITFRNVRVCVSGKDKKTQRRRLIYWQFINANLLENALSKENLVGMPQKIPTSYKH